jgi:hypothetical protein
MLGETEYGRVEAQYHRTIESNVSRLQQQMDTSGAISLFAAALLYSLIARLQPWRREENSTVLCEDNSGSARQPMLARRPLRIRSISIGTTGVNCAHNR